MPDIVLFTIRAPGFYRRGRSPDLFQSLLKQTGEAIPVHIQTSDRSGKCKKIVYFCHL